MSATYTVGVKIDGSAQGLVKAARDALRTMRDLGRTVDGSAKGQIKAARDVARARELLGVRSEREVQREILRTQAAYNRLVRTGGMGWREQQRAAEAMRKTVQGLNNEMGKLSMRQKAARVLQGGAMAAAGVAAGAAVLAPQVKSAMAYDLRLAHLSNTANSGQSLQGRKAGMQDIDRTVVEAVQTGGGTRESALDTYEQLAGSGRFKPAEIHQIVKDAVRAATASNAQAADFAQMAISANATFGVGADKMDRLFGMGTFAGQSGGFEIKDMSKWLPQQMAAAKAVGMSGEAGFAKLVAVNQAAVNTAGTKDEAGNNVVNLLAKMGSQDTVKDFKKLGIDLPRRFAEGRMQGQDALDVMANVLQEQFAKDKNYQAVQQRLATTKEGSAEYRAALQSAGDIAQGTVVGKVFQDRQALMALLGLLNDRARVTQIAGDAPRNADAHLRNMELVAGTASYKTDQMAQQKEMALQDAMNKVTPAFGAMADSVTGLMRTYPGYTTAIVGATTALTALAAASGAAGLVGMMTGGGMGAVLGKAGALALQGGRALARGGLFGVGAMAGGAALNAGFGEESAVARYGSSALNWAAGGALAGSLVPVVGTAVGAAVGGALGLVVEGLKSRPADKPAAPVAPAVTGSTPADIKALASQQEALRRALVTDTDDAAKALERAIQRSEFKGEVTVRVLSSPGTSVDADVKSTNPRIPMRADLGRTNLAAGF